MWSEEPAWACEKRLNRQIHELFVGFKRQLLPLRTHLRVLCAGLVRAGRSLGTYRDCVIAEAGFGSAPPAVPLRFLVTPFGVPEPPGVGFFAGARRVDAVAAAGED